MFKWIAALAAVTQAAPPAPVTEPEWVVIFRVVEKTPNNQYDYYEDGTSPSPAVIPTEIRVIVRAKSEGEAAIRAKEHILRFIVGTHEDWIVYSEAQQREVQK